MSIEFLPTSKDILCSRGKAKADHEGNIYFVKAIQDNLKSYQQASSRAEKTEVVSGILQDLQSFGSRFIKAVSGTDEWYELSDSEAKKKIGHALRDAGRYLKAQSRERQRSEQERIALKEKRKQIRLARLARRNNADRRTSILQILSHVRPTPQTKQQSIEGILRLGQEIACYFDSSSDSESDSESEVSNPDLVLSEMTTSCEFVLENEYPEEDMELSARSFFDITSR